MFLPPNQSFSHKYSLWWRSVKYELHAPLPLPVFIPGVLRSLLRLLKCKNSFWQPLALSSWKAGIIYSTSFLRKLRRNNTIVTELNQINLLLPCWYPYSVSVFIEVLISPLCIFCFPKNNGTRNPREQSFQVLQIETTGQNCSPCRGREHGTSNHWALRILVTLIGDNIYHCKQQAEIRASGSQEN